MYLSGCLGYNQTNKNLAKPNQAKTNHTQTLQRKTSPSNIVEFGELIPNIYIYVWLSDPKWMACSRIWHQNRAPNPPDQLILFEKSLIG